MPKANLTILRTLKINREQQVEVEVDVPQDILDEGEAEIAGWVDEQLEKVDSELTQACVGNWDTTDEDESFVVDEVHDNT